MSYASNDNATRVATLLEMLETRRPAGSKSERRWIGRWLEPLGMTHDRYGNQFRTVIGAGDVLPEILWSAHTDTVHRQGGVQRVRLTGDTIALAGPSECLGADNGAGVWLLREMILAGVPGLYVFHRSEESGGVGSAHIRDMHPELLAGMKAAIAFDRRGVDSVITHQFAGRCCSDDFADSLAVALGMGFHKDDGGSFTDTANYTGHIGECSNVSVGYANEHMSKESLNIAHLLRLRDAMLRLDTGSLVYKRAPGEVEPWEDYDWLPTRRNYTRHYSSNMRGWSQFDDDDDSLAVGRRDMTLRQIIRDCPDEVADFLEEYGVGPEELYEAVFMRGGVVRR